MFHRARETEYSLEFFDWTVKAKSIDLLPYNVD